MPAKYRATGRKRGPFFSQVPRTPETGEEAAARALQAERDRRAAGCLAELLDLLRRHRCVLQVVVQDIMVPGQAGSHRVCAVNVVPQDTPAAAPAAAENGKPA